MIVIALLILFYLFLRMLVVLYNFTIQPYLIKLVPENTPLVSILIPARNEADNIGGLLDKLVQQSYAKLEIIVYDDLSQDRTGEMVKSFASKDERISLITGSELPEGWLGKNHACHQLAMASKGDFMLFLDADVRPETHFVSSAVGMMQSRKYGLLSVFPHQIKKTLGEKITVSLMFEILLSLLPLAFIKKSSRPVFSGANGQVMLFERSVYVAHKPHWWKKDEAVEDMAIMQFFKKLNIPCQTFLGGDDVSCRMYKSGKESVNGFAKNVLRFFGNSVFFTTFHLLITSVGVFVMWAMQDYRFFSAYIMGVLIYKAVLGRFSKESILTAWLLIIPRHIMLFIVVIKAFYYRTSSNYKWKGRKINI